MGSSNSIQVCNLQEATKGTLCSWVFFWDTVIFYLYILATNSKKAKEKSVMKLLFVFNWQIISDKKTSAQKIPNQLFSNLLQYYSLLSQCSVPCF